MPLDVDSRAETRSARYLRRLRGFPWLHLAIVALVGLSAPFAIDPIRDAATREPVEYATLQRSAAYLLLAPISNVLDTITLLGVRQHIAFILTLMIGWVVWWWLRRRRSDMAAPPARRAVRIAARVGAALVLLLGLYTVALLIPRPMAALETAGPDLVAIDFHAHTKYSHDGRWNWEPEDVRRWHRKSGFHVAYISDHRTFEGARDAWANNPTVSGEGTVILPAIEVVWRGEHVNVLDADRMYRGLFNATLRDIDEEALRLASTVPGHAPILIETIPGDISKVVPPTDSNPAGMRAIEIVDGAPRGLTQGRAERAQIVAKADSFNLALVAGSDHHGWGHAASAWTLMLLPGWRAAVPEELSRGISTMLRVEGRNSTRVVERYIAESETGATLPFTVPIVAWGMFRTLSTDERVVWLAWVAAFWLLARLQRMRRRPAGER